MFNYNNPVPFIKTFNTLQGHCRTEAFFDQQSFQMRNVVGRHFVVSSETGHRAALTTETPYKSNRISCVQYEARANRSQRLYFIGGLSEASTAGSELKSREMAAFNRQYFWISPT
jgi:hypothetical protein